MFGGAPNNNDKLLKFLGGAGLHSFYPGFRGVGVNELKQLKGMSTEEVRQTTGKFNMPGAAVERLLQVLGKAGQSKPSESKPSKKKSAPLQQTTTQPIAKAAPKTTASSQADKTQAAPLKSAYYHGRPKQTDEFKPVAVADAASGEFQSTGNHGTSAWNPGNTYEDRDYTTWARKRLQEQIAKVTIEGGNGVQSIQLSAIKASGDASILLNRGKIKMIYNLQFSCNWSGSVGAEKVECKGKITGEDIACDEETDDWLIEVSTSKNNEAHRSARAAIESSRARLVELIEVVIAELTNKWQKFKER